MLRYIFGLLAFALALWAASAQAQAFVYSEDAVIRHEPRPFVSDDANLALHLHQGAANAATRARYMRAEAQFPDVRFCLKPDGHPQGAFDLTQVNWAALNTDESVEVCMFRLLNFVGTDELVPYFEGLGFTVTAIPPYAQIISYDPVKRRMVTSYSAGLMRDRSLIGKAEVQVLFNGTVLPHSASIGLVVSEGALVQIHFSLNTL